MPRDPRSHRTPHPVVAEPLEQRLLLSADLPLLVDLSDAALHDQPAPHVQLLDELDATRSQQRLEVVVVDGGIDGYERLVERLLLEDARDESRRFEVVVLDPTADGVAQVSDALAGMRGVDAVHVISHGQDGALRLGSSSVSAETLERFSARIKGWGDALADGADLLFYGCDLASGETGREFTREIARLTGADVAASDDLTGSALLGGDWELEQRVGVVESAIALGSLSQGEFDQVLATHTMYLGGAGHPVDSLERAAPANATPQNLDPARDTAPGLLLQRGGSGVAEADPDRYQLWSAHADAIRLDGSASLTLWSAVSGFDTSTAGSITAYLVDCDASGGSCVEIASATIARADWDAADSGDWIEDSFDFGDVRYTLGQGRYLGVKIVVDAAAGADMWIAADSTATPSRLVYEGTSHALDTFDSLDYEGDDGSHPWTAIWNDSEPQNHPTRGDIRIVSGQIRIGDGSNVNLSGHSLTRGVDLSGATAASLSFDYRRELVNTPGGSIELQVRSGGGGWTTLQTYLLDGSDASMLHESYDLTPWIAADTEFRFACFGSGVDSSFWIDNVQVAFETTLPTTNVDPVNSLPGVQQIFVDESLVFSSAGGNAISLSDDAGGEDVRVTLSVSDGALTLAGTTGLSFIGGDGSADASMVFTGSQADINAALDGLQYDPTAAWTGSATLTLTTNDLGNPTAGALDADPNLVLKYRFEQGGSDEVGSNDASFVGGASVVADPERGNVLYTDGVNDYAQVPTAATAGLTSYSFSLWIRTTESGSDPTYYQRPTFFGMHSAPTGDGDMLLTTNGGYVGFWTGRSGASLVYQSTTTRINDDEWHQVTVTDDGVNAMLFVDGILEGSLASGAQPLLAMPFRIGAASNGTSPDLHHQGYFDDVRVFDRALSPTEVANLYALEDTDTVAIDVVVNTAPSLTANALSLVEGQSVTLTAAELAASDSEHTAAGLQFTVSNVVAGQFLLSGSPTTSFLQSDVTSGNLQFVHDGSEVAPGYDVSVSDGLLSSAPASASIGFTLQNDAPLLVANSLSVDEGQTVVLGAGDLAATDVDDLDADLVFTVSNVTGGQFLLSGSPTTTFLQSDVTAGDVSFVHDGGEAAPAYDVSVGDGSANTTPAAAAIAFTNQNDAPLLAANSLTIDEGQTVVLGTGDLAATDLDDVDADLVFTVSNVTGGQFLLSGSPTTSFLQSDVTAGNVAFVHDGGELAPSYEVSVSDGSLASAPAAASVTFAANQADPPVLVANSISVQEGQTIVVGPPSLSAIDPDTFHSTLVFTVSNVTGGRFEVSGVPATSFTQSQVVAGDVTFVHDGGEAAPAYDVSVGDGTTNTAPAAAAITFTNQNDAPVLAVNSLTIDEGETVVLGAGDLAATDADDLDADLVFTVSNVTGGQFELSGSPTTSFLQSDLTAGDVTFVHDGGEAAPSYDVSVGDGTTSTAPAAAAVSFTNLSDPPALGANSLTLSEGQTVVLGAADLAATDIDDLDADLVFTVSNVAGGQFLLSGSPTTSFLQSDLTAGNVSFVHDGGEAAPSYDVSVGDGTTATTPAAAAISFTNQNDAPVLGANSLTIDEGQTAVLGAGDLAATDADDLDADLVFTVSNVTGGQFRLSGSPTTTFLQSDVTAGNVSFVHDGGEAAPSYDVSVGDGTTSTAPAAAAISFTNLSDPPVLGANSLTLSEGQTVVLGAADLAATDIDDLDGDLVFTVSNVAGGQFELSGSPTTSFLQSDITAGNVSFVHDGGEAAPAYDMSVGDGTTSTAPAAAAISFTNQNDAPTTAMPGLQLTNEDSDLVFSTATGNALVVGDVDDGSLSVDLTATGGTVTLATTSGVSLSVGTGTGDSALRMSGTPAALNAALDGLRFRPTPEYNGPAQVSVDASDGLILQNGLALIDVISVNDAPTLSGPAAEVTDEGLPLVFSAADGNAFSVDDVDDGIVTVTLTASSGTLDLFQTAGLTFSSGSGVGDATASFSGTLAAVNAALDGLRFSPAPGFSGSASLELQVSDGVLAQLRSVSIEVNDLLSEIGGGISPDDFLELERDPEPTPDGRPAARQDEVADTEVEAGSPRVFDLRGIGGALERVSDSFVTRLAALGSVQEAETLELAAQQGFDSLREERVRLDTQLPLGRVGSEPQLFEALERMRQDMIDDLRRSAHEEELMVSTAESAAIVIGVSLLAGLLRSSSLFALSLSSLPLWMRMDPLAILSLSDDERKKRRRELEEAEYDEERTSGLDRLLRSSSAF